MNAVKANKAWHIFLILLVFSVTGSTAALLPKYIMPLTGFEKGTVLYIIGYILLITPIYNVLLLGYAFIFGKFDYFYAKQKKMFFWLRDRLGGKPKQD